jgi:hypothetical protein
MPKNDGIVAKFQSMYTDSLNGLPLILPICEKSLYETISNRSNNPNKATENANNTIKYIRLETKNLSLFSASTISVRKVNNDNKIIILITSLKIDK